MLFGWRDAFTYFQCSRCECLQISEPPADLDRYYPRQYYSTSGAFQSPGIPEWCMTMLGGPALPLRSISSSLTGQRLEQDLIHRAIRFYFSGLDIHPATRILDVGCGGGGFLRAMRDAGYQDVLGVEPYLAQTLEHEGGLRVLKATLGDLPASGSWDLVMFHHSFEHVAEPLTLLRAASRLLAPGGACLIRMPVVPSHAWRRYGVHWVGLDAPRHLFVHSRRSLGLRAEAAGLGIDRVVYDSTSFQFVASEMYARDLPLLPTGPPRAPGAKMVAPDGPWRMVTAGGSSDAAGMADLEAHAAEVNRQEDGDQAAFYLTLRRPAA
jgi:SAM-dependent methyltransferase